MLLLRRRRRASLLQLIFLLFLQKILLMLLAGTNTLDPLFRLVQTVLRPVIVGINLQRLRKRGRGLVVLGQLRIRDAEVIEYIRVVVLQLRRFLILADRLAKLTEFGVSLAERVMSLRVVAIVL